MFSAEEREGGGGRERGRHYLTRPGRGPDSIREGGQGGAIELEGEKSVRKRK